VLDVDQHGQAGNGFAAFNRLRRAGLIDGAAAIVATPSGGLHAYFTGSGQRCGKLPGRHLDFRSQGGYIVAPPSQVGDRSYQVIRRQAAAAGLDWAQVTGLLEPGRNTAPAGPAAGAWRADRGRLAGWVAGLAEGNRNDGLFWAACRAAEAGDDAVLADLARAAATAGLPDREIAATIGSARRATSRAEHQKPRIPEPCPRPGATENSHGAPRRHPLAATSPSCQEDRSAHDYRQPHLRRSSHFMSPAAHPPSGQDKAPAGPAATTEHQCPECGEPAASRPPDDLVPYEAHGLEQPAWSHRDGSPLCPVPGPSGGYEPASPAGLDIEADREAGT
jgi:hypothetical protein